MSNTSVADSSSASGSSAVDESQDAASDCDVLTIGEFLQDPEVCNNTELAVRLIYEDFCQREEAGFEVDPDETLMKFPRWRPQLEPILDGHKRLRKKDPPPRFPAAGEEFGEFRFLAELGRGAKGRVFLAIQPALCDRPVVVKMTPRQGSEHLSLARLQHSSIVPLYLVQDHEDRNLRLLCMPYLGGTSLDRILKQMRSVPIEQRSGRHFLEALRQSQQQAAVPLEFEGPALQFLARASYPQAACWIGACLADALQYAHGRGLVHLDVKPSNVLLAGDGQPMLLDFHLAHEMTLAAGTRVERLGGTPDYMSPEQRRALDAAAECRPIPVSLDGRSDIYSLGLILHELLVGGRPERNAISGVAPGVARILRKCLAEDPRKRYADAGLVAADLRGCLLRSSSRATPGRWPGWVLAASAIVVLGSVIAFLFGGSDPSPNSSHASSDFSEARARRESKAKQLHELVEQLQVLESFDATSQELEPDHPAHEQYAIGRALYRAGQWEAAAEALQTTIDLDPRSFWPQYYRGLCAFRLGQFEAALAAFSACTVLAPEKPECFVHRAAAFQALGRHDLAARDLATARRLDPSLNF